MIIDFLLPAGFLLSLAGAMALVSALKKAPEGTEDESGFRYLEGNRPVSRPPFASSSSRLRSKKKDPAGIKIPAA